MKVATKFNPQHFRIIVLGTCQTSVRLGSEMALYQSLSHQQYPFLVQNFAHDSFSGFCCLKLNYLVWFYLVLFIMAQAFTTADAVSSGAPPQLDNVMVSGQNYTYILRFQYQTWTSKSWRDSNKYRHLNVPAIKLGKIFEIPFRQVQCTGIHNF